MPLLVNCPTGCQIRVPSNRAGRVVRCPKCKNAIRIAAFEDDFVDNGQVIEVPAKLAKKKTPQETAADVQSTVSPTPTTELPTPTTSVAPSEIPPTESVPSEETTRPVKQHQFAPAKRSMPASAPIPTTDAELNQLDPAIQKVVKTPPRVPPVMHSRPWRRVEPLNELESPADVPPIEVKLEDQANSEDDVPNVPADNDEDVPSPKAPAPIERETVAECEPEDKPKPAIKGKRKKKRREKKKRSKTLKATSPTSDTSPAITDAQLDALSQAAEVNIAETLSDSSPSDVQKSTADFTGSTKSTDTANHDMPERPSESLAPAPSAIAPAELPQPVASSIAAISPLPISVNDTIENDIPDLSQKPAVTQPPVINLDAAPAEVESEVDKKSWEQRLNDANADRRMLARFLAVCLMLVAVVNIVPAIYHWYSWSLISDTMPLPRWIYLQIFIGSIYTVYAIFLLQVNDWSALRAVSVAMLVVAFVFGAISTGLLAGSDGNVASILGIPFSLNRQAGIWCVAMLLLATLMSYWSGKESSNWRRAEAMLEEILQHRSS